MSLLQPLALVAAISLPVIILLYMLKKRTRAQMVSSTLLWERLDRISTPSLRLTRLLRNLLLLLQLLVAALLVLALARPALDWAGFGGRDLVIIIDTSISMGVDDGSGTRLDQAILSARRLIEGKSSRDQVGIIAMGRDVQIVSGLSANAPALLQSLSQVRVNSDWPNVSDAMLLAENMAATLEDAEIILFSDGSFGDISVRTPQAVTYSRVGSSQVRNLVLESLISDSQRLYLTVVNNGSQRAEATITISDDQGESVGRREVSLEPQERTVLVWRSLPVSTWYRATASADQLAWDNEIYAITGGGGQNRLLLVSEGNLFLERALVLSPGLQVSKVTPDRYRDDMAVAYEYFVFDGYLPAALPSAPLLVFDPPHPNGHFLTLAPVEPAGFEATRHPLLNWVDFTEVDIRFSKLLVGGNNLLNSGQGSLAAEYSNQGHPLLVFGFAVQAGDLALRPAFPILIRNVLDYFSDYQLDLGQFRYGQAPVIHPPYSADTLTITSPGGNTETGSPPWPYRGQTLTEAGVYTIAIDGSNYLVPVNPPVTIQPLAARDSINLSGQPVETRQQRGQFMLFAPLALLALAVVALEWWVDNSGY